MDLSVFFQPISSPEELPSLQADPKLGTQISPFIQSFPDWEEADLLLCSASLLDQDWQPTLFRKHFYSLSLPHPGVKIADLGHLKPRESAEDCIAQLAFVLKQVRGHGKPCILLLDDPTLSLAQLHLDEGSQEAIEYVHIDSQLDLLDSELILDRQSMHHALLREVPAWLFDYVQLGYQGFLVSEGQLDWLKARNLTAIRYGALARNLEEAEPFLRTAHVVGLDLSAVRGSDAPAAHVLSPGGFSTEEVCRLARYAGLGYRTESFSISGYSPADDRREQTSRLAALTAWYFVEGRYNRLEDFPREDRSNLTQYAVQLHASIPKIDFFKHPRTERWWMEVPYPDTLGDRHPRTKLVPCSESDYQFARTDDIPARWWAIYQKLS